MRLGFHAQNLVAVALLLAGVPRSWAVGSPPLVTDDPATPGNGHWEINLGVGTEQSPGVRRSELPLLDINYGLGETVQIKCEVPYLVQSEAGHSRLTGWGNSGVGVKWRFHDAKESGLALSVYPQFEFNTPGSASAARGLVDSGPAWRLPMQVAKTLGAVTVNFQWGRELRRSGDSWFYGAACSRRLSEKLELAVEFVGAAAVRLDRSRLALNLGLAFDVSEHASIMASIGRELHNHDEPRVTLLGYVGWQLRR